MNFEQALRYLVGSDRVILHEDEKEVFTGYASLIPQEIKERLAGKEVTGYRCHLDIKHKEWAKRGLMPPIQPDELAQYNFSDLQLSLYYCIYV